MIDLLATPEEQELREFVRGFADDRIDPAYLRQVDDGLALRPCTAAAGQLQP